MKFTYDFIKENIKIYNQAKESLPVISQFEQGLISHNSMRSLGLDSFVQFYLFTKSQNDLGFDLISALSYKELKEVIVKNTKVERFRTYFSRRTQPQFKKLISEDSETFDRLLNGRWISKPNHRRRGRRHNERAEGLETCFVPLINYMISNDVSHSNQEVYKKFFNQERYYYRIKWFTGVHLEIDKLPKREIELTFNLLNSFVDFISETQIDFRKLNSDFIIDNLQTKLRSLMTVPSGTSVKSLSDYKQNQYQELTKDKTYEVVDSSINGGYIRISVINDRGYRAYYDYSLFEDVAIQRDLLLSQLGI